jgi:golgi phosphoprotein 3
MTEASGLSRRRVNTGPVSTPSSEPSSSTFTSHAGSAFAGGNKVAFDPRDLERDEEESRAGGKIPPLTLMEEVLLLGLKDRQASSHAKHLVSQLEPNAGLPLFLER